MKIIPHAIIVFSLITFSCSSPGNDEFVPLFNGKDLTGWNLQNTAGFEVIDGELVTRSFGSGTDIYTTKMYSNFILQLDFMLSEVGNSGVFIRRDQSRPGTGFEVQLLAPWTPWRDDLHCTGSLYGHVAVTNRPDETTGHWYRMEIKCDRNNLTVSVDGEITTAADIDTVKTMEGMPFTGYIGLQGNHAEKEGQYAKFRNISIQDLDADPEYVIKGFKNNNREFRYISRLAAIHLGAVMIGPLAEMMSTGDPMEKSEAKQALFDVVAKASDPLTPAKEKRKVRSAVSKSIKRVSSEITKDYLIWISGMIIK
ncbi:MAG TPA: hypothetical protein DDW27_22155 [Bacteroidales bacterium]|nr:hypothetical protein [Bacteroidales bacterium]